MPLDEELQKATFSAGKFWGVQFYFDQIPGVISSRVGYMGGHSEAPTAETVASQNTGHAEVVELHYDPSLVNYDTLLKHFFKIHDPTQAGGQGKHSGDQFRSEIFYHIEEQRILSDIVINQLQSHYSKPIITKVTPASIFYEAASEDQKYTQSTGHGMNHVPYEPV